MQHNILSLGLVRALNLRMIISAYHVNIYQRVSASTLISTIYPYIPTKPHAQENLFKLNFLDFSGMNSDPPQLMCEYYTYTNTKHCI